MPLPLLALSISLLAATPAPPSAPLPEKATVDLLGWFKMNPAEFACHFERTFGHRDPKWNCKVKKYRNRGNPCSATEAYYEGPELPDGLAKRIHPRLREIALSWEHGALQNATLHFDGSVPENEARSLFGLPPTGAPPGFVSVSLQDCSKAGSCLVIEKFDHLGAGEAGCGEGD